MRQWALKLLFYIIILIPAIQACSIFKRTEKMEDIPSERLFHEEQQIEGGRDATAEYFRETGKIFQQCLQECLLGISVKCFRKVVCPEPGDYEKAGACYDSFFNSLKGGTNLSREDVERYIAESASRYSRFFSYLDSLKLLADRAGIIFEIKPPGSIFKDPYWDFGPEPGCNILVDKKSFLFAIPPCEASTYNYMTLQQEPVAASLIHLNRDCMLFLNSDQDPGEKFFRSFRDIFTEGKNITNDIEGACQATLFPGRFLLIDPEKEPGQPEIGSLMEEYGVPAVVTGNAGTFRAAIYLKESYRHHLDIRK